VRGQKDNEIADISFHKGSQGSCDLQNSGNSYKKDSFEIFENRIDEWFTTKEAAQYLRISEKNLLNLSSNGKIRHYKFGRRNRYLRRELRELILGQPRGGSYGN
jgi:excisionase family DNA binding protein